MNKSIHPALAAAVLLLSTWASSSAHAEKFPYRLLEVEKGPPLEAPEPGEVTLQQTPPRRVVSSGADAPGGAPAAAARKGWDGTVKGSGKGNAKGINQSGVGVCKGCTGGLKK